MLKNLEFRKESERLREGLDGADSTPSYDEISEKEIKDYDEAKPEDKTKFLKDFKTKVENIVKIK